MKTEVKVHRLFQYEGHSGPVYALEKGLESIFFSGSSDGIVALWDSQTAKDAIGLLKAQSAVYSLHFISEKNWLAVGLSNGFLHVIDIVDRKIIYSLNKHNGGIFGIQHDHQFIYTVGQDGKISATNISDGQTVSQIFLSHKNLRFLQLIDQKIMTGGSEGVLFELDTDGLVVKNKWQAHQDTIFSGVFYDNQTFLTVGKDALLKRWDLNNLKETHALPAHLMSIHSICFSPDKKYFITSSMDKTFKIWNTNQMKLLKVIDKIRHNSHHSSVNQSIWIPYNDAIITCSDDKNIIQWALDIYDLN